MCIAMLIREREADEEAVALAEEGSDLVLQ